MINKHSLAYFFSSFQILRGKFRILRDKRGVAMLIAIVAMIFTVAIAVEVAYETSVGYVQSAQQVDRIKAYYAATSGVDLSLFRIMIYRKVLQQYGQQLSGSQNLVDMIWNLPFAWPPTMLSSASKSMRDDIHDVVKKSAMDAQYAATIESESGRIDINALGSGNAALINATRLQLLQLFQDTIQTNDEFKKKYQYYNFNDLLNNIEDWVSPGAQGIDGRDKASMYKQPDDVENYQLPPDAPFKTFGEIHMVAGMKDDFYNLLKSRVTVYGDYGINVNYADASVLESLDPQITDKIAQKIINRRTNPQLGGPFQNSGDFYNFLQGLGVNTQTMQQNQMPLIFGPEYNFRITSIGTYRNVQQEITVITYDIDSVASRYATILSQNAATAAGQNPNQTTTQTANNPNTSPATSTNQEPIGKPRIVMWNVH